MSPPSNLSSLAPVWDVIVIGAGPAGGVAAIASADHGLRTLLVEKKAFPRAKVCGGCLNPRALSALESLGLRLPRDAYAPVRSLELWATGRHARVPLPGGAVVDRSAFDAWLANEAAARGATFVDQVAAEVGPIVGDQLGDAREVRLTSADGDPGPVTLRARVVVAADGLAGGSLQALGGARQVAERSHLGAGAVVMALDCGRSPGSIGMHVGRQGYVGIAPVTPELCNVAAALAPAWVREQGGLASAVAAILAEAGRPGLAARVDASIRAAAWQGVPLLTSRPAGVAAERLLVVGDATGYVEPFTGEGMAWAIVAAAAAAPLVAEGVRDWRPELATRWTRLHAQIVRRGWCTSLAWLLRRRWFVRGAIAALAAAPWLARPVVRGVHTVPGYLAEGAP